VAPPYSVEDVTAVDGMSREYCLELVAAASDTAVLRSSMAEVVTDATVDRASVESLSNMSEVGDAAFVVGC